MYQRCERWSRQVMPEQVRARSSGGGRAARDNRQAPHNDGLEEPCCRSNLRSRASRQTPDTALSLPDIASAS